MNSIDSNDSKIEWLRKKINYGATYKGMITFTLVWLFVIVLFLSTFSEPIKLIFGDTLLPIELNDGFEERAGRIVILYHSIAIPVVAVCTYFALMFMDVREKFKSRVKWPLFLGSLLTSSSGILFAYIFHEVDFHGLNLAWIFHGLYLVGLSLCFFAGIMLLLGVFPTGSFPKRDEENRRNVLLGQYALSLVTVCILLSASLGGFIGSFFGNGMIALLAEYFLRDDVVATYASSYNHVLVDAVKAHLHIMLALIDTIILLVVYRYTVQDQKGKWYGISMALAMPGMLIMSIGSWAVTFNEVLNYPFDMHYLIYAGSAVLVTVGLILALTGWQRMSKAFLGDKYESASWVQRIRVLFRDPVKFSLYFHFIWVNFVMTFGGIFLALSLRGPSDPQGESPFTKILGITAFRDGPLAIETTVARGHWHILATLTAVMLVLLLIDVLDIKGSIRNAMGWLFLAGSIIAFGFGAIYLYYPHFNTNWATNLTLFEDVAAYWKAQELFGFGNWLPIAMDLGIMLFVIALAIFCFNQLIQIIKGRHDVKDWPE
jgi:hypothetical protein